MPAAEHQGAGRADDNECGDGRPHLHDETNELGGCIPKGRCDNEVFHDHTSPTDGVHIPVRLMTDGIASDMPNVGVVTHAGGCRRTETALCIRQNCDRYVYPLL